MKEIFKKIWGYLTLRKEKSAEGNINLKLMHGINRISLIMFVLAILFIVIRLLTK